MAEKKKYPWIKSLFKRKKNEPVECVYAGPEYFKNRNQPRIEPVSRVYAGPENIDRPEEAPVYAGPEVMEAKNNDVFEDVYAGPEFFGNQPDDEPEEDIEEPEKKE